MRFIHPIAILLLVLAPFAHGQQPWAAVASPTSHTLWNIVYGNSLFVAVGESGTILTSVDGQSWQAQTSGTDKALYAICWAQSPKLWVAVGEAGTLLTSSDAVAWTSRASGTNQRLNSVAWNQKQYSYPDVYLAVGENGAAIRSFDAATWSACNTGDAGSLRAIVAGSGWDTFIVAGHDGTILTTSDDGDTFQRKPSGTSQLLTAVALISYRQYYATGADLAVTISKDAGGTWSLDRSLNTDGRENGVVYHGLAPFNGALAIVGDAGRIVDEFDRPWAQPQPLSTNWRAVAASPTRIVAVGTEGGIASAPVDPGVPREFTIAETLFGDRAMLAADPVRTWPGQSTYYQWSYNGAPIDGANKAELTVNALAGDRSGTYSLTVTFYNSNGTLAGTATASAVVATLPIPAARDLVDTIFQPHVAGAPHLIVPIDGGKTYVAGTDTALTVGDQKLNGFARLNPDGSLDLTLHIADGVIPFGTTLALIAQPDGRVVLLSRTSNSQPPTFSLTRFLTDGTVDSTFKPDTALVGIGYAPILLADGRWLAVQHVPTGSGSEYTATLRRFLADGAVDSSYTPIALMNSTSVDSDPIPSLGAPTFIGTRDTANRIYVGVRYGDISFDTLRAQTGHSRIFRLLPDGTLDPSFTPVDVGPVHVLQATPDGLVVRTLDGSWARLGPTAYQSRLYRLNFDGTSDLRFHVTEAKWSNDSVSRLDDAVPDGFDVMAVAPDGAVIARSVGRLGHLGMVRFGTDGKLDADFSAELGQDVDSVQVAAATTDGAVLVGGTFTALNGINQPYLARLIPNRHAARTHLQNLSARAQVTPGTSPLIAGFVIVNGTVNILARGAGPALAKFDVSDRLSDPSITLFGGTTFIGGNDNWSSDSAALIADTATSVGAFPFPDGSLDAALVSALSPRDYTLHVTSGNGTSGVALAEVYDANAAPADSMSPRLINLSVRTDTAPASGTLIAGFTITGDNARNVVIRAVGPGLAQFGVTNWLVDPMLTLYRGDQVIGSNDDWAFDQPTKLALIEAFTQVGAFAFDYAKTNGTTASKDAAILVSLTPGDYTVQVTGKNGAYGNAMVEVYEVK